MIQLVEKERCCGCSACLNACKFDALTMQLDNTGFSFPMIDESKCVECKACERACPILNKVEYKSDSINAYIVQNKDDEIRKQSTSGGAFTGIAKQVIAQGGVVFGASINSELKVNHIFVETEIELSEFRSSKYVESNIGMSYKKAEEFLKEGRLVCFSGTPCQIYALKQYLKKDYENLIAVDVMCRAVPSPKVLQKYLDYQKEKYPSFDRIVFRDKARGYSYSCVTLYSGKKVLYRAGSESDPWLRLFLGGYCNRETCHECLFQTGVRASDITMWDCWGTQNYEPKWDDNKGTTNIITWTEKGDRVLNSETANLRIKEIGIENIDASLERELLPRPNCSKKEFYDDLERLSSNGFIEKYVPMTIKIKIKKIGRHVINVLHLHNAIRKIVHKIRKYKRER